jgi:Ca2+-binding RTX toxin-like protein
VVVSGTSANLTTGVVNVNGTGAPLPLGFTVQQFENIIGSNFNDTITGNTANNSLNGGAGNDTIFGLGGNDTIDGGSGIDTASYDTQAAGVTVSLALQGAPQNTVAAGSDLLISIENLIGTAFNDSFTGNGANNSLASGAGNDIIFGSAGNDTIDGGAGLDIANYSSLGGLISLGAFGVLNKGALGIDNLVGIETVVGSIMLGDTVDLSNAVSSGSVVVSGTNASLTTGLITVSGTGAPLPLSFTVQQFENVIGSNSSDTITGNATNNILNSGAGNDTIFASTGNDSIDGGAGLDTANYSSLGGLVSLGAFGVLNKGSLGVDSLVSIETVVGSSLLGDTVDHSAAISSGSVVFSGTNTNLTTGLVTVNGTGAPLPLSFTVQQFENVIGSNFNDTITGDAAANSLTGGAGNDTINGLGGNDTINGGTGIDTASYDTLAAGVFVSLALQGSSQNTGAAGSDLLISIENLIGSAFNDTLEGDIANNSLASGAGNDTIFGSGGNDAINGGSGTDIANYSALGGLVSLGAFGVLNKGGFGVDNLVGIETVVGSILLGDTVDLSAAVSSGSVVVSGTSANLTTGVINVNGTGAPLPLGFTVQQFENIIGSNFNDTITGNTANNSLNGGAGNDSIFASSGNDNIDGGAGLDVANYSSLGGLVSLGAFGVLNKGTLGIDNLVGIETIVGSSLLGDTVDHSAAISSGSVVFSGTNTNLTTGLVTVSGTGAPLPLSFTVQQFENVIGSNFNDTITGDAAANSLTGGAGNDTINGLGGNDTINGGSGIDTASYDTVAAGVNVSLALQGSAQNTGAAGSDLLISIENLIGTAFNDTITGDGANNSLASGAGNDTIFASAGIDTIDGGSGTDIANYSALGGLVSLGAFGVLNKGALGVDSLVGIETVVGSILLGDTVDLSAAVSSGSVVVSSTSTNLTTGLATVNGTGSPLPLSFTVQQFENVIGSNFNDTITGNAANNFLNGGTGNDTISGLGGSDTLTGGLGNDAFNYTNATESAAGVASRDTITDFQLGLDKLDLGAIDANSLLALDQSFSFLGNSATFTNAGQLRYQVSGGNLFLFGNIDANFATSEFELQLSGLASIATSDIIL